MFGVSWFVGRLVCCKYTLLKSYLQSHVKNQTGYDDDVMLLYYPTV